VTTGTRVPTAQSTAAPWRNRIVGQGEESPADLVANPKNWRLHPQGQQDALAGVLDQVGWVSQVLVNRVTGRLVDGHLRVEIAARRGEASVPVSYVELSEPEEALILATLDPLAALAEVDNVKLAELLASIEVDNAALELLLKDLEPRQQGRTDPDAEPEVPAEPYVKSGELWLLGEHRLLVGDATKAEDVARLLAGAEPTLLATDPPYGVSLDPTWRDGVYNALGAAEKPYMRISADDGTEAPTTRHARTRGHRNTTLSGDTRVDWSEAFGLVPSLRVGYVWHAGVHAGEVAEGLTRIGFEIVSQIIWDKGLFAMGRSFYHWRHEPCWVVRKPGSKVPFLGERNQSTIWEAPSPKMIMGGSKEEKQDHLNRPDFGGDSIAWRNMESWHTTTRPARSTGGIPRSSANGRSGWSRRWPASEASTTAR
jgi:hypothetical protein